MRATRTDRTWGQTAPSLTAAAVALIAATLTVAFGASPNSASAQPVTTIPINSGNVPTTAEGYDTISCDNLQPGAGQDGWLFVMGGPPNDGNGFVSLSATFSNGATYTVPPNGTLLTDGNNPDFAKVALYTPAGLTLTSASAVITDSAPNPPTQFQLSHACPYDDSPQPSGSGSPSPSPSSPTPSPSSPTPSPSSPTPSPSSPTPSPSSPTPSPSSPTPSPSSPTPSPSSPTPSPSSPTPSPSSPTPSPSSPSPSSPAPSSATPSVSETPRLPVTGADPGPAVGFAVSLLVLGTLLIVAARRRRLAP